MDLQHNESYTRFPEVRINIGKKGINAIIDGKKAPKPSLDISATRKKKARPRNARVYTPFAIEKIQSADVEELTSPALIPLRDMLMAAGAQRVNVDAELAAAISMGEKLSGEYVQKKKSLFRFFYKRRIAELETLIPEVSDEAVRLHEWKESTKIDISFDHCEDVNAAWEKVVTTFTAMMGSARIWDVVSHQGVDQFRERSNCSHMVRRVRVKFDFAKHDLLSSQGSALRFENANGDDILLYPGVALIPRADGAFALIDLRELNLKAGRTTFQEGGEEVPKDTKIIDYAWFKSNKDGSPDRRFRDNYTIPIVHYGQISFATDTGMNEEYNVSNAAATVAFGNAFRNYQRALQAASANAKD